LSTFKIQLISATNSGIIKISIIATLITAFILTDAPDHEILFFVIMVVIYTSAFLLHLKFVVGRTEWKVDDNGITITWVKKIPFAHYKDIHLSWVQIKNVQRRVTRYSDTINIILRNGTSIKYYHNGMTGRDDIKDFLNGLDAYCE
jgi:hypothetical protein